MSEAETQNLSKIYGNARNNALSALTQGVKSATSTLKQQASYDITEAFNNYKQQQLALKASTFGTGSKDYLTNKNARAFDATSMATAGAFENQYNNLVGNALSNASSVNQSYADNMAKGVAQIATDYAKREEALNKIFAEQGVIMDKIQDKVLQFAKEKLIDYDENKLYTFAKNAEGQITHRVLTQEGKALYKQVIEGDYGTDNFRDYGIRNNWFTSDEYDQYIDAIKGGLNYNNPNTSSTKLSFPTENNTYTSSYKDDAIGFAKLDGKIYEFYEFSEAKLDEEYFKSHPDEKPEDFYNPFAEEEKRVENMINEVNLAQKYKYYPAGTIIKLSDIPEITNKYNLDSWFRSKKAYEFAIIVTKNGIKPVTLHSRSITAENTHSDNSRKNSYVTLK